MKIALLHYAAPPVVGGVESVLAHQARLLAAAGHTVKVIAGRGAAWSPEIDLTLLPLTDSQHPDILRAKSELDAGSIPATFARLVDDLEAALAAALVGQDILIAHNVCSLAKNLALTAALHRYSQRPHVPRLILWHHDLAWTTPRYRSELHPGYPWDLLRTDWPHATQVVISEPRRQELAKLLHVSPERIQVIPNGIDISTFFKLEAQTQTFIRQLDLLTAAPLLLLPVRLTPRKNLELALHTVAALRDDFPATQLLITGPLGPHNPANAAYFERLKELRATLDLTRQVHFLTELAPTYLPDAVIADFYRLADALFLPSLEEGFGLPMLEAGLSGLPIFCSDIPALRAVGGTAAHYFSPESNPSVIAGLIAARLRTDSTFILRVQVRQQYTWEQIYAEKISPLLEKTDENKKRLTDDA